MSSQSFTANGWTSEMPAGWEDRSTITVIGETDESGFASNIVVTRQDFDPSISLADYARAQAEMTGNEVDILQILDEREVEINGTQAFQRLQRLAVQSKVIQQVQTFFKRDRTIFAVTGSASVESFDRAIPGFRIFVEKFKFN